MIRPRAGQEPLFYTAAELPPAAPAAVYTRLTEVVGDWRALARPLEAAFSSTTGRPVDPVVYLKIFLIGYLENLTYDTDLAERIDDSRRLRAFLGYPLTEPTPDHSSISRVRHRLAACDLSGVLEAVVALGVAAGLVTGAVAAVDATLLRAHVSRASFRPLTPAQPVEAHVAAAAAANPAPDPAGRPGPATAPLYTRVRSTTDPDARLARKGPGPAQPSYQLTEVTDGAGVFILAAAVTPAEGGEAAAAGPALAQAQAALAVHGLALDTVVADAGYDAAVFQDAVTALPATPLTPLRALHSPKAPGARATDFTYDPASDTYTCPEGHRLPYHATERPRRRRRYVSDPTVCAACPRRAACLTPTGARRWLSRPDPSPVRAAIQAHGLTPAGQALLARRQAIVEGPFGHHKTYGGLGRVTCRGLGAVRVKCLFAAIAWNLRRLGRHLPRQLRAAVAAIRGACTAPLDLWGPSGVRAGRERRGPATHVRSRPHPAGAGTWGLLR